MRMIYRQSWAVTKDNAEAARWFTLALKHDERRAQRMMGMFYIGGVGVGKDVNKGIDLLKKSSAQGDAIAARSMGDLYYKSLGVKQDLDEAYKWYKLGAERDDKKAINRVAEVKKALDKNKGKRKLAAKE